MKNIKILLLQIRNKDSFAIRILHRLIEQKGYAVKSIFMYDDCLQPVLSSEEINLIIERIKIEKPNALGISLTSYEYKEAIEISKMVRKACPETLIIWGGFHPTIAPESCVEYCDFACIGEGEGTIIDIANLLAREGPQEELKTIQNLAFKHDNKYCRNPLRPPINDLDSIPFPDFSHRNKIYIHGKQQNFFFNVSVAPQYRDEEVYQITTSRGCPNKCSYCCSSYINEIYKGYCYLRRRSINSVIKELMQAKIDQPKLRFIIFHDAIFTIDLSWVKEFAQEYKTKVNLPFLCQGHINNISEEVIIMLKRAGLKDMNVGIQSGSERIRKEIFWCNTSDEDIVRVARILKKHKIKVTYDLICNAFETKEDKCKSFKLFLRIPKPFIFNIHNLVYYMNTPITKYAIKRNIISDNDDAISGLQGRVQLMFDPRICYGNNFIGNDPHYRLLKAFGKRYVPNLIIKLFVGADGRIVKLIIYIACLFKKLSYDLGTLIRKPFSFYLNGI